MKWIGQHIVDFIARFRSDVYLEDISTGTIASGGNLGLDSNNKIVKADEDGATLTTEAVQDIVGGMFSSNTETRVAATYVDGGDGAGKINIVVDDMTADTTYAIQDGELSQNNFTNDDHTKLDGIEASATADQSNAEIRTAVEAATDSNVFTDADHTKLNGIEASATADQTQADINGLAITTVGTIGTGVWNGTAIASAYLDADTVHLSVDQEITSKTQINKRQFSTVGASTGDCEGDIIYFGTDAASHVAGNIYTLNSSSQWVITDADATATSIGLLAVAMGTAATDGMCIRGMVNLNTTFAGSPANGAILYLDGATPGAATGTAPTGNGDVVRVLGYRIGSGTRLWFNPDNTFVEVTA